MSPKRNVGVWMAEPLVSSDNSSPDTAKYRRTHMRPAAHIGAARAVPRPIHFEVADFAPFPIGG